MSDTQWKAKVKKVKYPLELKNKALLELAESGSVKGVARHYNVSKQTLYNWRSDLKRKNKRSEKKPLEDSRHFQELLELKRENAKLKERVRLLRDIVKKPIEANSELNYLYTQNGFELMYDEDGSDFLQLSQSTQSFFREKGVNTKLSHAGFIVASSALCFAKAYGHSIIQKSIEKGLIEAAKSSDVSIKPLDTVELRNKVISEFYTFADVEEKVRGFPYCPDHVAQLSDQYKRGDMSVFKFDENFAKIVFRDRNKEWLTKFILAQQNHDSIFIAAGVAHFTGPYNLLEMLKNEGFTVSSGF